MGGCRCVFNGCSNSTEKTPGIHFFHFPVFDKVRCYNWVLKSNRPELLNLKLSQLKNRVICEKHFSDDMFMNDRKNKLIHYAVPDSNSTPTVQYKKNSNKDAFDIKIAPDDQAKYFTTREKQALFSVPYNNFLSTQGYENFVDPLLTKSLVKPTEKSFNLSEQPMPPTKLLPKPSPQKRPLKNNPNKRNVVILSEKKVQKELKVDPAKLKPVSPSLQLTLKNQNKMRQENVEKNSKDKQEYVVPIEEPNLHLVKNTTDTSIKITSVYGNIANLKTINQSNSTESAKETNLTNETPALVNFNKSSHVVTDKLPVKKIDIKELKAVSPLQKRKEVTLAKQPDLKTEIIKRALLKHKLNQRQKNSSPPKKQEQVILGTAIENIPIVFDLPTEITKKNSLANKESCDIQVDQQNIVVPAIDVQQNPVPIEIYVPGIPQNQTQIIQQNYLPDTTSNLKADDLSKAPDNIDSFNSIIMSKVNENSRNIAEIKEILLSKVTKPAPNHNKRKLSARNEEERKRYLFQEISEYISTELKNDLYEEMFLNYHKKRKGK